MSTHPTGPTLFDSIVAHLAYPEGFRHPDATSDDLAPWETSELPDCQTGTPWTTGIVGQLTSVNHAVLLHRNSEGLVDNACVTVATVTKHHSEAVRLDPYLPWRRREPKEGDPFHAPLVGDLSRAAWRDLDAILADPASTAEGCAAALSDHDGTVTVITAAQERGKGTDKGWALVRLPADLAGADPQVRALISAVVLAAERVWTQLQRTVASLRKPGGDQAWDQAVSRGGFTTARAAEAYWPGAETVFLARLDDLLAARVDPLEVFRPVALHVFDDLAATIDEFEHLPRLLEARRLLLHRLTTPKETADAP